MMLVEAQEADDALDVDLVFTKADLRDVVPHDNDPVVISIVTVGRKVHRVLVDQGSSADMMFWTTFNKLQLSSNLLRLYTGCLYSFAGDQVEVRGHLELRTTFTDGTTSSTENIRYLIVNAPSAYNILLGRPTLNRKRAVSSTRHMKMKLPDVGGKVITIKSDQKEAKSCYESNLKTKRGVFMVTTRAPSEEGVAPPERVARERRPEPSGEVLKREIGGRMFKLGKLLAQAAQDQITEVIARHLDAFTWSASDMTAIDPKVRPVHQRRRKSNERRKVNLDLLDEAREEARIKAEASKRRVEYKYSSKLKPRQFQATNLVMRKAHPYQLENKLSPKWTGPLRVIEALRNGAYRLETLEGGAFPRTWNATNLKFYFN
ncbi:uncharacterized protein [Phaseolus vulgaris]|uniref:uncharacterized protein n=1 Tax=Phaseolus vulgaris TaxID=3885 RepID=UPI0035CAEEEA